ncbi:hypothetical protein R0H02_05020 [Phytobacter ursingii]|uniref:Transposase n=1 Tax=Phytobacter ursingii TaxID=1972431 RepID=A0AB35RIH5_9ENTR|nr:hypothetical protein [Phytobacter ursingii]MDV2861826.1 hypothetical protein [Phytobacter ursingii]
MALTQYEYSHLSQMQKCTCEFLHFAFSLCGGEA